ncbi:MAG: DUF4349 domain-containing protein [Planctomycetota bacterium]
MTWFASAWVCALGGCASQSPRAETFAMQDVGDGDGFADANEAYELASGGTGLVVQEIADPQFGFGRSGRAGQDDGSHRSAPAPSGTAPTEPSPPGSPPNPSTLAAPAGRLLIFEGRFALLVPNVADAVARCQQAVEAHGGYLQARNDAALTFRVPAEHFKTVVNELGTFGLVVAESLEARDVTREYRDLDLRIHTLTKALERLTALLDRAEKVEEILEIEREVRRLTEEIERLRGELRFLQSQIAYSTLHVHFSSNAPAPHPLPRRKTSRFPWVNEVGIEQTLRRF